MERETYEIDGTNTAPVLYTVLVSSADDSLMLFCVRGFATAARAKSDSSAFAAVGLTSVIGFQAFLIVGGVTKLLPLTGVTLPFMQSSMAAGNGASGAKR